MSDFTITKTNKIPVTPTTGPYDELLTDLSSEKYLVVSFSSYEAALVAHNIIKARTRQLRLENISNTLRDNALYLRQELGFTPSENDKALLLSKVERVDDCWMWIGPQSAGYGVPFIQGRQRLAHRLFYQIYNGPVEGLRVRSTCGNRGCVNPNHLRTGHAYTIPTEDNIIDVTMEDDGSWNIPADFDETDE